MNIKRAQDAGGILQPGGKNYIKYLVVYWGHLSRLNNLLVIMNISIFFLTGLVAQGYYYTFISLLFQGIVGIGILIPTCLIEKLWYYLVYLVFEIIGLYFLLSSIWYWVRTGN